MADNYSLWADKTRREEQWLAMRPLCSYCGHPIQDEDLYDFEGELYHEQCMNDNFKKRTEDYMCVERFLS